MCFAFMVHESLLKNLPFTRHINKSSYETHKNSVENKKRAVSPQVNTEEEIYQNTTLAGHQSSKVLWKTVLVIDASTH